MNRDIVNYYLVLEKRPGDFNIIDINKLDICDRFCLNKINEIDLFTSKYSELDIMDAIKRANLAKEEYLDGKLRIISDKKHNLDIINKDVYDIVRKFQNDDTLIDNNFKNKLYGSYKKIVDKSFKDDEFKKTMLNKFNNILKESNKKEMFEWLEKLPYENIRDFYLTIYNEIK